MRLAIVSIALLCVGACQRDHSRTCEKSRAKIPARIGFQNFAPADVDTLILRHLALQNGSFIVTTSDTMIDTNIRAGADGILRRGASMDVFFSLAAGETIDVEMPGRPRIMRIDRAVYTSSPVFTYQSNEEGYCDFKGEALWPPDSIDVDGQRQSKRVEQSAVSDFLLAP